MTTVRRPCPVCLILSEASAQRITLSSKKRDTRKWRLRCEHKWR